jgi:alpha-galactosidase
MWAALKSPLLMGNDLRTLNGPSLTILNNPAIIAISQDPLGRSAQQISRNFNVKKDRWGMGETQVWSGHLSGGDQLVIFFNAADEDVNMEASLEDIFYTDGPNGSADQIHERWEVHDLWANRMSNEVAQRILDATTAGALNILQETNWYNSSTISYKEGLKAQDPRLLGKKIGVVEAEGTLQAKVLRHSVGVFRLRSSDSFKRYTMVKDEL